MNLYMGLYHRKRLVDGGPLAGVPDRPKQLVAIQTHSSGVGRDRRVGGQGGGDSRVDGSGLQAGDGVGALGANERPIELRSVINVVGVQSLFPGASSRSIFIMRLKNLSVKDIALRFWLGDSTTQ
jgi:hypothetical protein